MKLEDIKTIGIVGGGVMGGGIAQTAILAGYKTIVRDLSNEILTRTKDTIINGRFGLKGGVERGKHTQEQIDRALANLSVTTKVEGLKDCDLIIEAIGGSNPQEIENKDLKLKVFAELDRIIKKEAIFASNTSHFTIADLAKVTNRKDRFIGMHWFSPANVMRAVEVVYTPEVKEEVIQIIEGLCQKFGKTSARVKDVPGDTGFVGNRIMGAVRQEAKKIVNEGIATAEDINKVMMGGFNWPVGPLRTGGPGARTGWQ
ncbi:MAG: 3-hydroxyacyl-CoA dehydrogenase family protein [Dehalococcoidia bacterium]